MAKKVRRKPDEPEEATFEFPEFDERAFLAHEFEQYSATLLAFVLGVILGVVAYVLGAVGLPLVVPLALGFAGTGVAAYAIRSLRPGSSEYTTGDWAALVVLMFFGFLGIWFLLAEVLPARLVG